MIHHPPIQRTRRPLSGGHRAMYLLLGAGVLYHAAAFSQSPEVEQRLKAVYLLNFLKFAEWPDTAFQSPDAPIILHVMGKDPFGRILEETFESEKVGEHPIVVRRLQQGERNEECHMSFISASENERVDELLTRVSRKPVLTVSDIQGFVLRGGMVGFYREGSKLRFEINMRTMERAGVRMTSKILRLARLVNPL